MGRRQDWYKILNHQQPDKLIIDFGGNPLSSMEGRSMYKLLDFLGFDYIIPFGRVRRLDERLLKYFDIDTRSVGTILTPVNSQLKRISNHEQIDEWGIRRKFTGMYWEVVEYPLKGSTVEDLDHYFWPDPESINYKELEEYAQTAKKLYQETDYIVCAEHPVYGVFELGCWLCGFEDFLTKMVLNQDFVKKLFDIILNYQKSIIKTYYSILGDYIHYTSSGDDFATQESLFLSPDLFRKLIKPYFRERINYTRKFTEAAFLHHSCGSVYSIIEDLIDCGVDILNPIQPNARDMEPEKLKNKFGNKIVFHGGIDTQEILPFGDRSRIEKTVKETIEIMNKNGGYIFAAAHNIQEDVLPENLVYMFKSARKYGQKEGG